jgi:hypothetical protein
MSAAKKAKAKKATKPSKSDGTYSKYKCDRVDGKFSKKENKTFIREHKRLPKEWVESQNAMFDVTGFWYE